MKIRLGMSVLVAGAAGLYFPLNRMLTGGFNLATPLDAWIPLWPVWVVPYLLCLPAWAGGLIWAAWKMNEQLFRSFISACLFVLLFAALFFFIFPTYVERPILTSNSWAAQILQLVYQNDGVYNAFPSGHVFQTSLICLFYNRLYPNHKWMDQHCIDRHPINVIYPPTLLNRSIWRTGNCLAGISVRAVSISTKNMTAKTR